MFSASPFFPRFIFTIAVVQVPWLPVTEGHVTPFGVSLGVRMRNRKLRNIKPSGAFLPEVTL
jgi:hypothetical protein